MGTFAKQLGGVFLSVVGEWAACSTVAGAFLYAVGYLSVRFKLTALGMGADLDLLDERYVLEGVKFLMYLASSVPVVVMGLLPLMGVAWVLARMAPSAAVHVRTLWNSRTAPLVVGVLLAVAMIQLVMRQCFLFDNLLLRVELPEPKWFRDLLTSESADSRQLFYTVLLAGTMIPTAIALSCRDWLSLNSFQRLLVIPLLVLVGIQLLLLPVNYAVLTAGRSLARLAAAPQDESDAVAWLIWEGKTGATLLIRDTTRPKLVTFPGDKAPRFEIIGFEPLAMIRDAVRPNSGNALGRYRGLVDDPPPAPTRPGEPAAPFTWDRLVRVFGIAAVPEQMRAAETVESQLAVRGDVMVLTRSTGHAEPYADTGNLRSPLFVPGETDLLALQDDRLVRIQTTQGTKPLEVAVLPNVIKLIGFDPQQSEQLLFLAKEGPATRLKRVNLTSKQIEAPLVDLSEPQWAYLLGESRAAGTVRLFVEPEGDGARNWWSIHLQDVQGSVSTIFGKTAPGGRQPALSTDGKFIAFVRVPAR